MDNYLLNFDNFNKSIIYRFELGYGGIGDLTRYFMYLLTLCIKNNVKLYYFPKGNIIVDKFFKIKYPEMYISEEKRGNPSLITNMDDIPYLTPNIMYETIPYYMYNIVDNIDKIEYSLEDVFYFTDNIKTNANNFLINNNIKDKYISIHLRLGDKHLETEKHYVFCTWDERIYNEDNIFKFIENNMDKTILFFCDNNGYKLKIKNKYNNVKITNFNIGHTSLPNTTEIQFFDTITEFYLLSNSDHIYKASTSGFPCMAAKFKNIEISDL